MIRIIIETGNDAMSTEWDVARTLREIAETIERGGIDERRSIPIRDMNGNTVGRVEVGL